MLLNSLIILKTRKEKKVTPVKKSHFNETAKVIQQFIRDEEAEDRRASPRYRLYHLKEALNKARDVETHERLEKEIRKIEMQIKFGESSEIVHTLPEDKAEMIMENYRIEKSEAEVDLSATNSEIEDLERQSKKIQKELQHKKYLSRKLKSMIEEATAVEKAFNGELTAAYYDDYPTLHARQKGLSELIFMRIKHLKEDA